MPSPRLESEEWRGIKGKKRSKENTKEKKRKEKKRKEKKRKERKGKERKGKGKNQWLKIKRNEDTKSLMLILYDCDGERPWNRGSQGSSVGFILCNQLRYERLRKCYWRENKINQLINFVRN